MASTGRGARDKGQRGERHVADLLTQAFPHNLRVRRNIDQSRLGGEDVKPDMVPGFSIEVKWQEQFQLKTWWGQAVDQAIRRSAIEGYEVIPALVYKRNRVPWRVRLPLRLFIPYAHIRKTIDVSFEEFITVIKYEQHRFHPG